MQQPAQVFGRLRDIASCWRPAHCGAEEAFAKRRWSMRFSSPEVEDAFVRDRLPRMLLNTSRVLTLLFCVVLRSLVKDLLQLSTKGAGAFTPREWIDFAGLLTVTVVAPVVAALARLPWFQSKVGYRTCEGFIVGSSLFLLAWTIASNKTTWGSYEMPAPDEGDCHPQVLDWLQRERIKATALAEIRILALLLDAFMTVMHLALPLRWYIFFWLDAAYIVTFAVQAYRLEPFLVVVFLALVIGACAGTRSQELAARTLFATVVDERTRRAQAEFSASLTAQQLDLGRKPGWDEATHSSDKRSRATAETTDTAALFSEAAREESLDSIVDLGLREQWLIRRGELDVGAQVLGSGGCGTVFAGRFCNTPVAVKRYVAKESRSHAEDPEGKGTQCSSAASILNELRIFRHVRHPNVVLFYGAFVSQEDDLLLVLERIRGPTLNKFVARLKAWQYASTQAATQVNVMLQVINTLTYLHSRRPAIVHADLKPSNVVVETREGGYFPKLLDFGLARTVTRGAKLQGGTPQYVAPEIVRLRSSYRPLPSCDVFSLGRVLFFVACGRAPLAAVPTQRLISMMRRGEEPPSLSWAPRTSLLERQRGVIESCTAFDPQSRPAIQEVFGRISETAPGPQEAHGPTARRMESIPESPEPVPEGPEPGPGQQRCLRL